MVRAALLDATWERDVGPNLDFMAVWPRVAAVQLVPETPDTISWSWEKNGDFEISLCH